MREDIAYQIKNSDLFGGINDTEVTELVKYFRQVSFPRNDVICRENETGDRMYLLLTGEIAVSKELGLLQRELKRMRPGEIFGELALISEGKRAATLTAATDVECLELGEKEFSRLLDDNSRFAQEILKRITARMKDTEQAATQDLLNAYQALIFSLAKLAESRDPETGAHLNRVRAYTSLLAELLSKTSRFAESVSHHFVEGIYFVSPLHDIGKVAIPDAILLKPQKLSDEEYKVMKTHTEHGADTIQAVLESSQQSVFQMAHSIVLHHHERYDGKGYPKGLQGDSIPLEARIMALADVYDALLTVRPYKSALSYPETMDIIQGGAGSQFDPEVTKIMVENIGEFERIHHRYRER